MRKSGLQKQISSIFSEVPAPQANADDLQLPQQQPLSDTASQAQQTSEPEQALIDLSPPAAPTAVNPVESVQPQTVSMTRPKPLPKQQSRPEQKSGRTVANKLKKTMAGSSSGKIDARQKKLTVLVGFLSVTFAGVLFISLGGLGQKKTAPGNQTTGQAQAQPVQAATVEAWQMPEPLPADLRDAVQPAAAAIEPTDPGDDDPGTAGQMTVTGIVFSKDNPSAIVDGKFVRQGDTINGATIIAISKESVEFEQNGKRWTQQVHQ